MNKEQIRKEVIRHVLYPKKLPLSVLFNDLSVGEFILVGSFLAYESEHDGKHITVNELASNLAVAVPSVSRSLRKLEERGLISRVTDENCRRNTFVIISEKGKELFKENEERVYCLMDKVMQRFSTEEINFAINFHRDLQSVLDSECKSFLENKEV